MSIMSIKELERLIKDNQGIVNFGSSEDSVSASWYSKAEAELGIKLSESYLWFLKNYSCGEILGDEVFSIYGMEFKQAIGGDIVYQHLTNLKNGLTSSNEIVIMETNFGEAFFFDYNKFNGQECPIYLRIGSEPKKLYANDFYEFLHKRIMACIPLNSNIKEM